MVLWVAVCVCARACACVWVYTGRLASLFGYFHLMEQADGERGAGEPTCHNERLRRLLQEEMRVCADAAGRYPSNYNAWSHRIWVLQHLAKGNLKVPLSPY